MGPPWLPMKTIYSVGWHGVYSPVSSLALCGKVPRRTSQAYVATGNSAVGHSSQRYVTSKRLDVAFRSAPDPRENGRQTRVSIPVPPDVVPETVGANRSENLATGTWIVVTNCYQIGETIIRNVWLAVRAWGGDARAWLR